MKQCYTKARRANRPYFFLRSRNDGFSLLRSIKRGHDKKPKTFGCQTRLQAITLQEGFMERKTKFILHAV